MSLFERMRILAFSDTSLQAFFGSTFASFRFFDRLLPQGYEKLGTCARVTTVSQVPTYLHSGRNPLTGDRVQIDVIDASPSVANAAAAAIDTWLETVNFADNRQFASPVRRSGGPPPNFKLNQRGGLIPSTERMIPVESLDYRILNVNA